MELPEDGAEFPEVRTQGGTTNLINIAKKCIAESNDMKKHTAPCLLAGCNGEPCHDRSRKKSVMHITYRFRYCALGISRGAANSTKRNINKNNKPTMQHLRIPTYFSRV